MIRYMICPIHAPEPGNDAYHASVEDVSGVNIHSIIPSNLDGTPETNPNYGKPKYNFALCIVATGNVALIAQVQNAFVFPDYNLDGRMDGMEAEARTGLVQSVQAYDLDGQGLHLDATHADSDSYRSLIDSLGKQIDPIFQVNSFGVHEVSQ